MDTKHKDIEQMSVQVCVFRDDHGCPGVCLSRDTSRVSIRAACFVLHVSHGAGLRQECVLRRAHTRCVCVTLHCLRTLRVISVHVGYNGEAEWYEGWSPLHVVPEWWMCFCSSNKVSTLIYNTTVCRQLYCRLTLRLRPYLTALWVVGSLSGVR